MCAILTASFFHLEQNVRDSEVGENFRSVIDVVKFIRVFSGTVLEFKGWSKLKILTVPILEPVAKYLPSLEASITVV